ncbi:hypothetical protein PBCVNEJV1_405R [Paramecium bursaria Chlorella virus NE-JV-1]|nr:hypothetical protein PBCVNEJV1_405R [Paramecium bursaria Chlorella virus NE-JV-1]
MSTEAPYLCVYASQTAACINENRYKKIADAVETFWNRADPVSYKKAMRRNNVLTNDEIIDKVEKSHPKIATLLKVASKEEESSTDVAQKYAKLSDELGRYADDNYMSEDIAAVVDDAIRKTAYTTYGNTTESDVFKYIRDVLHIDIVEDPSFYKDSNRSIHTKYGTFEYSIGGKIDGITRDRKVLVEIKNRVNRLFGKLPNYEMIQVQTYLHLLDMDKAFLVECLKTKDGNVIAENVNCITVNRDRSLFEMEILPKIEGFVDFVINLIHDEKLQDKFLTSKRRNAMASLAVTKYLKNKIASKV